MSVDNPVLSAVNRIKREIPKQILEKVFMPTHYTHLRKDPFLSTNLDNEIIQKVINGIVRLDCDTAGATEATIPLRGIQLQPVDNGKYIFHVPKTLTNGRVITSALALIFYGIENISGLGAAMVGMQVGGYGSGMMCNNGNLNPVAAIAKSNQPQIVSQTTNIRVVDGHTILVEDIIQPTQSGSLRCILAHDSEFSTLSRSAWFAFGKLCVFAAKSYIYNNYIIDLDMAELVGGRELGKFKEIIEGYADATELYNDYFETKWRKIQFMADEKRHERFIKAKIGRYI